jgi:hypothetical protein
MIADQRVMVVSARDLYELKYGDAGEITSRHTIMWKREAFELCLIQCFNALDVGDYQHLISIGDSRDEYEALMNLKNFHLYRPRQKRLLKAVVFKSRPNWEDINIQIVSLTLQLQEIMQFGEDATYVFQYL